MNSYTNTEKEFIEKNPIIFFYHKNGFPGGIIPGRRVDFGWFKDLYGNKFYFDIKNDEHKKIIFPKGGVQIDFGFDTKKGRFIFPHEIIENIEKCYPQKTTKNHIYENDEFPINSFTELKKDLIKGDFYRFRIFYSDSTEELHSIFRYNKDFNFYEEIIIRFQRRSSLYTNVSKISKRIYDKFFSIERKKLEDEIIVTTITYPNGTIKSKEIKDPLFETIIKEVFYPNQTLKEKFNFTKRDNIGFKEEYFMNGNIKKKTEYKNGEINGEQLTYRKNGVLKEKYKFNFGKKRGIQQRFYSNGTLKSERKITGTHPNGIYLRIFKNSDLNIEFLFNESGIVRIKQFFKNGKKDGLFTSYHENEQLHISVNYINGKLEGEYQEFYETGVLVKKGFYLNHKKEGLWEFYYPNGVLLEKGSYIKNFRHGIWEKFSIRGKLTHKRTFNRGKEHGKWENFDDMGNIISSIVYINGKIV